MPVVTKNNLITFAPNNGEGERVPLSLEGDFELTPGIEPNVNTAIVDYAGMESLGWHLDEAGTIEFWYSAQIATTAGGGLVFNGQADRFLKQVRIVEVEPVKVGFVPGQAKDCIAFWRIALADTRERFAPPLGGILNEGLLNPDADEEGKTAATQLTNSELLQRCLARLGLTVALPAGIDAIPAPKNLRWSGVYARDELARLLDHCGCMMIPLNNGTVSIVKVGAGIVPNIGADRAEVDITLPGTSRRGSTVIFTSAPTPVVETIELTGPSQATFQYVLQDSPNFIWRPIDDPIIVNTYFFGSSAAEEIKKHYSGVGESFRDGVRGQAFHAIQISDQVLKTAGQSLLRRKYGIDAGGQIKVSEVTIKAKRAVQQTSGGWKNSQEMTPCRAGWILGGAVVVTWELLGKVDGSAEVPDFEAAFVPLSDGDMEIVATIEASTGGVPEYANFGYTRQADGSVQSLNDAQVKAMIEHPISSVSIISRPDLRMVRDSVNNKDNRAALESAAQALAIEYFRGASTFRILTAQGFVNDELSGRVTSVKISQRPPRTTFTIDNTNGALGARLRADAIQRKNGRGDTRSGESHADPLPTGSSAGGRQPSVPMTPYIPPPALNTTRKVYRVASYTQINSYKRWMYKLVEQEKKVAGSIAAWSDKLSATEIDAFNLIEANNDTSGLMGNGVTLVNGFVDGTQLTIQPAPINTRVEAWCQTVTPASGSPTQEFWFQYENGVDGGCE